MISYSGIDCSGKSTQIALLEQKLKQHGKSVKIVWSRGGFTPGILLVKKIIRKGKSADDKESKKQSERVHKSPVKSRLLLICSMIDLWFYYSVVLRVKNLTCDVMICDRYIWDTYVDFKLEYPHCNFEKGFWWNLTLKTMLKPEHSFVFFISPEESVRRSLIKKEPRFEPIEMRKKRIEFYMEALSRNSWENQIDGTRPKDEIFRHIWDIIKNK